MVATSVTDASLTIGVMLFILSFRNSCLPTFAVYFERTGAFVFFQIRDNQYAKAFLVGPRLAIGAMCSNIQDLQFTMVAFFERAAFVMRIQVCDMLQLVAFPAYFECKFAGLWMCFALCHEQTWFSTCIAIEECLFTLNDMPTLELSWKRGAALTAVNWLSTWCPWKGDVHWEFLAYTKMVFD